MTTNNTTQYRQIKADQNGRNGEEQWSTYLGTVLYSKRRSSDASRTRARCASNPVFRQICPAAMSNLWIKTNQQKKRQIIFVKAKLQYNYFILPFFQLCIIFRQTEDVHLFTKTNKKLLKQKFKLDRNIYIFNIKYLDIWICKKICLWQPWRADTELVTQ